MSSVDWYRPGQIQTISLKHSFEVLEIDFLLPTYRKIWWLCYFDSNLSLLQGTSAFSTLIRKIDLEFNMMDAPSLLVVEWSHVRAIEMIQKIRTWTVVKPPWGSSALFQNESSTKEHLGHTCLSVDTSSFLNPYKSKGLCSSVDSLWKLESGKGMKIKVVRSFRKQRKFRGSLEVWERHGVLESVNKIFSKYSTMKRG